MSTDPKERRQLMLQALKDAKETSCYLISNFGNEIFCFEWGDLPNFPDQFRYVKIKIKHKLTLNRAKRKCVGNFDPEDIKVKFVDTDNGKVTAVAVAIVSN